MQGNESSKAKREKEPKFGIQSTGSSSQGSSASNATSPTPVQTAPPAVSKSALAAKIYEAAAAGKKEELAQLLKGASPSDLYYQHVRLSLDQCELSSLCINACDVFHREADGRITHC